MDTIEQDTLRLSNLGIEIREKLARIRSA